MSTQVQQQRTQQESSRRHRSLLLDVIGAFFDFIVLLFFALVFSVCVEWLGIMFFWPEEGVMHSQNMLVTEVGYLNDDFTQKVMGSSPADIAVWFGLKIDYFVFEATYFNDVVEWLYNSPSSSGEVRLFFRDIIVVFKDFIASAINSTQVFGIRLAVAALSLPIFILFGLAGLIDGLVQRELRRYGGANESSFVYHNVKPWMKPMFISAWFIYLGMPVSIHPNLVFLPAGLMFGILIYVTSSMFKKYL